MGVGQVWPLGPVPAGPMEWGFKGHFRALLISCPSSSSASASHRPGCWGGMGRNGSQEVARPWWYETPKDPPLSSGPRMRTEWWSWLRDLRGTRGQRVTGDGASVGPPHVPDLLFSHLGLPGSGTKAREPHITSAFPRKDGTALKGIFNAASP